MKRRTRPTMRTLLVVLLLLVAGAIVNVAVAWGCAYWLEIDAKWSIGTDPIATSVESFPIQHKWSVLVHSRRGGLKIASLRYEADRAPQLQVTETYPQTLLPSWMGADVPSTRLGHGRVFEAYGWPIRGLAGGYEYEFEGTGTSGYDIKDVMSAIELSSIHRHFSFWNLPNIVIVPLRPLWPGFAINTLFYAAILWGLFAAPFALRRRRRIKRGLCPKCAYDLRGCASRNCPECGAAVTPIATEPA